MKVPISISVDEEIAEKLKQLKISPSDIFNSIAKTKIRKAILELVTNSMIPIAISIILFFAYLETKGIVFLISFATLFFVGILYIALQLYELIEVKEEWKEMK